MYKVTRFYSEPQDKTTVQIESQSVDSPNYDYYVRILAGDYREKSDEEVIKAVLDMVRIQLSPNEAIVSLDEKLKETDEKIKEMDDVINKAEQATSISQMAVIELTEMVYTLLDSISNAGGGLDPEPEPEPEPDPEPVPDPEDPELGVDDLPDPPSEPVENEEVDA